jgi:hypothetical protein
LSCESPGLTLHIACPMHSRRSDVLPGALSRKPNLNWTGFRPDSSAASPPKSQQRAFYGLVPPIALRCATYLEELSMPQRWGPTSVWPTYTAGMRPH